MRDSGIQGTRHPKHYRIVISGEMSERFASEFEGMSLESGRRETTLRGEVVDQSHLHGILARIQDLGLELVSVTQVPEGSSPSAGTSPEEEER